MSENEKIDRETAELQNPDNWDYDSAELHPPVKNRRTVVSVSLPSADFQLINAYAERMGMRVSEMIRKAALEKASPQEGSVVFQWAGSTYGTYAIQSELDAFTVVEAEVSEQEKRLMMLVL